jgi:hypothetical protein
MSRLYSGGDFKCAHCHHIISSAHLLSGVNNRNHCPYCLWSRHLDLYTAGDRLSACKAPMQPLALTTKQCKNKYGHSHGELMLVHECSDCGGISINRIAADDDAHSLLGIFSASRTLPSRTHALLQSSGIEILPMEALPQLQLQLFGRNTYVRLSETA